MRKYLQLYSNVCFFYDCQQKLYLKTATLLPMKRYSRVWLDFTNKNSWVWERNRRVLIISSPIKKFREKYGLY